MLKKVISGGQTGADRCGLYAAKQLGIPTGGYAPLGFRTEKGYERELLTSLGLIETNDPGYNLRTRLNVKTSNGTVIFGNTKSPGSKLTLQFIDWETKPFITNPSVEELINFIYKNEITVLNVAGNRGSKMTTDYKKQIVQTMMDAFKECI